MGSITRSLANNITTGGVILPAGITNSSVSAVTSFANAPAGTLILLSTQTASASATISFTTGLNSTYDEYQFHFINMHPATDGAEFMFNMSTDAGSNYNVTKTTTAFSATHNEAGTDAGLSDNPSFQLSQSTAFQYLAYKVGNLNDNNASGDLTIFNPASTTYVKHFIAKVSSTDSDSNYMWNSFWAGYGNTTSAVNAIQFKFDTGNMDDGIIKLYGVKKS